MCLNFRSIILCGSLLCIGAIAVAQDADDAGKAKDAAGDAAEKQEAVKAKPSPVKIGGVFESAEAEPLTVGTKHISSLIVKKILSHGTMVNSGQPVIWIETEKPDKQIKDAERALRLAELTMSDDDFAYEQFIETQKLDRAAADRSRKAAQQSFDNFTSVDHERQIASAKFSLKLSESSLENVAEELKQLEQMYKEDNLVEESEEIVLKRAKQSVESAKFRLEGTKVSTQRNLTQTIPRNVADQEDKFARAEMAYAKKIRDLEGALKRRDMDMTKKREALQKQIDDLKELKVERNSLVIRAPFDGIFYHGAITRGKLSSKQSSLKAESTVTGKQVLGTVAKTDKLQIRLDVTEVLLRRVQKGANAKISPTVDSDASLNGKVKSIGSTPYVSGKFDCVISINNMDGVDVVPGMACQVEILEGKSK